MRRTLCLLAVAASLGATSLASAQTTPNPEAVRRFQIGKQLRDEGKCDKAIPELEASVHIEPSIGGHYNLGVCYEAKNKKLALANYQRAEEIAKDRNDERLREIRAQHADFLARTPHIRLALPQPLPPDIHVTVDGDIIPPEELQGETIYFVNDPNKAAYDVRVTAPGYDEVKLAIDSSTVKKNMLVTVVMKKPFDAPAPRAPVVIGTKWGPLQFLGLGLIALGAGGVTYSSVSFISYLSDEENLRQNFERADLAARDCDNPSPAESSCGKNIATREQLRADYNANEQAAKDDRPVLLAVGIGGILAVAGGVLLIVFAPRSDVYSNDPGASAKNKEPSFRLLPTFTARTQGLSLIGTF